MKQIIVTTAIALALWGGEVRAQTGTAATQTMPGSPAPSATVEGAPPAGTGLADLDAMTFGCPKAALNAAAREAARIPSQGTYQFSFFRIVNDSHHPAYEVRFKSNYEGEAELKYCVSLYCQQGWDPRTAKTSVTLMGNARPALGAAVHGADCGSTPAPVKRRLKR